ncbi:MAG: DUF2478 domain-containing protein [Tabrizicola sp.]
MRLGVVVAEQRSGVDRILSEVADRLATEGWRLAGAVQENPEVPGRRCDMDLILLGNGARFRISESRGVLARGCRLDPAGLEAAAGAIASTLETDLPDLVIINKFGKSELAGRGFRPIIARALELDLPVIVGLNSANRDGFEAFAQGLATPLPARIDPVLAWCQGAVRMTA